MSPMPSTLPISSAASSRPAYARLSSSPPLLLLSLPPLPHSLPPLLRLLLLFLRRQLRRFACLRPFVLALFLLLLLLLLLPTLLPFVIFACVIFDFVVFILLSPLNFCLSAYGGATSTISPLSNAAFAS